MFDKFKPGDLVAYSKHPNSLPLGYVEKVEERQGRAMVSVRVIDTTSEDEFLSIKLIKYNELDRVSVNTGTPRLEAEEPNQDDTLEYDGEIYEKKL